MFLLNQSRQQGQFQSNDRQPNTRAREQAEALFRPKQQIIEPSLPADPALAGASTRRPRVLSASAPPTGEAKAEGPINSAPQIGPEVSALQFDEIRLANGRNSAFDGVIDCTRRHDRVERQTDRGQDIDRGAAHTAPEDRPALALRNVERGIGILMGGTARPPVVAVRFAVREVGEELIERQHGASVDRGPIEAPRETVN